MCGNTPILLRKRYLVYLQVLTVCSVFLLTDCLGEMLVELLLELRNNILLCCFKNDEYVVAIVFFFLGWFQCHWLIISLILARSSPAWQINVRRGSIFA